MEPDDAFELEAQRRGFKWVAGLDEVGRGPLAGPVVAAAVILPRRCRFDALHDSKQLSEATRERLYGEILGRAVGVGIGTASAQEIDALNILEATRLAMQRALAALVQSPDWLLIDAVTLPGVALPQRPIIKGDALSRTIAAASVVAKVHRDRLMVDYHQSYPRYNFSVHKGYATAEHVSRLNAHGPCPIHRRSFRPVLDCVTRHERPVIQGDLWDSR